MGRVLLLLPLLLAGCTAEKPYCYVEAGTWGGTFDLYRARPFPVLDRHVGIFGSVDLAVAAAKSLGCEVQP